MAYANLAEHYLHGTNLAFGFRVGVYEFYNRKLTYCELPNDIYQMQVYFSDLPQGGLHSNSFGTR